MNIQLKNIGILTILAVMTASNISFAEDATENFAQQSEYEVYEKPEIKSNRAALANAKLKMNEKDFQAAINYLDAYIATKPKKYEAYSLRGDCNYELRRYAKAEADYLKAIELKSVGAKFIANTKTVSAVILGADRTGQDQNPDLGVLYGKLMYAQKAQNKPEYEESYQKAFKYNSHIYLPKPNASELALINCPQKYGKPLDPQGDDKLLFGAIDDIQEENFQEAMYKLHNYTIKYPNYYLGHYLTGVALIGLEQEEDALVSFTKAVRLNRLDFESLASIGQIYFNKASKTFNKNDYQKSINYFRAALALNKNCYSYYFYIGLNEFQSGDYKNAIKDFEKALALNPKDYNSMYYKMLALYMNEDYQHSIDASQTLIAKKVSNINSVLYSNALSKYRLQQYDKALEDLDKISKNLEDIYNSDLHIISEKEKTLDKYVAYLKSEILRAKGKKNVNFADSASENPIIDALANKKNLSDIPYEDIDNQYDYIKTTFNNSVYQINPEVDNNYSLIVANAKDQLVFQANEPTQQEEPLLKNEKQTLSKNKKVQRGTGDAPVIANAPRKMNVEPFAITYGKDEVDEILQNQQDDDIIALNNSVTSGFIYDDSAVRNSIHSENYRPLEYNQNYDVFKVAQTGTNQTPQWNSSNSFDNIASNDGRGATEYTISYGNNPSPNPQPYIPQTTTNKGYVFTKPEYSTNNILITSIRYLTEEERGATDYVISYGNSTTNPAILATSGLPLPMSAMAKGETDYVISYGDSTSAPPVLAQNTNTVSNSTIATNSVKDTANNSKNSTIIGNSNNIPSYEKGATDYVISYGNSNNSTVSGNNYVENLDLPYDREQPEEVQLARTPMKPLQNNKQKTNSVIAQANSAHPTGFEKGATEYKISYGNNNSSLVNNDVYDLDLPLESEQPDDIVMYNKPLAQNRTQKIETSTLAASSKNYADRGATDYTISYKNTTGTTVSKESGIQPRANYPTKPVTGQNSQQIAHKQTLPQAKPQTQNIVAQRTQPLPQAKNQTPARPQQNTIAQNQQNQVKTQPSNRIAQNNMNEYNKNGQKTKQSGNVNEKYANVNHTEYKVNTNIPTESDAIELDTGSLLAKSNQNQSEYYNPPELNLSVPIADTTRARKVQKDFFEDDDYNSNSQLANVQAKEFENIEDLRKKDLTSKYKVAYNQDNSAVKNIEKSKNEKVKTNKSEVQTAKNSVTENQKQIQQKSDNKNKQKKKSLWKRIFGKKN